MVLKYDFDKLLPPSANLTQNPRSLRPMHSRL